MVENGGQMRLCLDVLRSKAFAFLIGTRRLAETTQVLARLSTRSISERHATASRCSSVGGATDVLRIRFTVHGSTPPLCLLRTQEVQL